MSHKIDVVVGGQYGSEGKGHVAAQRVRLAVDTRQKNLGASIPSFGITNVRVAGPNAGHTVVDADGSHIALRQVPVGVVYPDVDLYIAPGSEIDVQVLAAELLRLRDLGHSVAGRMYIAPSATILTEDHIRTEQEIGLAARLGSTAKGIGAARADRIMRTARIASDDNDLDTLMAEYGIAWAEPSTIYPVEDDQWIVVEGTQGYGLGLHTEHYPKVTSSDTRAIDFMAMAGLHWHPSNDVTIYIAARVYPIRVAGDSGGIVGETSWEDLGLPEERTTVTQKVRRVGAWDDDLLAAAIEANGGHKNPKVQVVLTMIDQKFPEVDGIDLPSWTQHRLLQSLGKSDLTDDQQAGLERAAAWASSVTARHEVNVGGFTTSANTIVWTER